MTTFIVIAVIVFVLVMIIGISGNMKQKNFENAEIEKLRSQGIELTKQTKTFHGIIGIDQTNEKLVLIHSKLTVSKTEVFTFADIFSCELIRDGETIYKKSTTRTIGGAIVGGVLTGGVGAVIGGLSGGSKGKENIKNIELKIVVRDLSNPTHRFVFYESSSDNKALLDKLIKEAESWKDTLSLIIDMKDKQEDK